MAKFKAIIRETIEREVEVYATDKIDAATKIRQKYRNGEYSSLVGDEFTKRRIEIVGITADVN